MTRRATELTRTSELAGKRALVTGASRGIGRQLAGALAGAGADVAVAARSLEALETTVKVIEGTILGRAVPIAMDVTRVDQIRTGVAQAAEALGGLDLLVNNAGVEQSAPALEVEEETWDLILDTNLKGAFFTAQAAARIMDKGRGAAILNICSLTSHRGIPTAVPYGSSKSGLLGMTRALATEWGRNFIRVNALAPGYFHTDMTEHFYLDQEWRAEMLGKIPIARFGHTDDLAGAAVFLLSDAARYITGACLPVDGGILASI
jgi:NAD(P)-dependent dehydrogenase (short-subunit alcohol dehydrogenase family)